MQSSSLRASTRRFSTAATAYRLPVLRLPTTLFPQQCLTLSVDEPNKQRRYGAVSPALKWEAWRYHDGRFATLAWGTSVGVELQLLRTNDRHVPPGVAHAVGGRRLQLLSLLDERTPSGGRLGLVAPLDDEPVASSSQLSHDDAQRLRVEAAAARDLLENSATPLELTPCTQDEELGLTVCDPRTHPLFRAQAAPPENDAALSLWLAARLSLTTSLRAHLLALTDPLKRMRDVVDAMRMLSDPRRTRDPDSFAKFVVVWDTAESGGCELEDPVPTIDWARNAHK